MMFCECSPRSAGFTIIDQCSVYSCMCPFPIPTISCPSNPSCNPWIRRSLLHDPASDGFPGLGSALIPISMDIIRVIEVPCGVGCVIDEGRVWTKPDEWILSGHGSMILKLVFPTSINLASPPLLHPDHLDYYSAYTHSQTSPFPEMAIEPSPRSWCR